MANKYLLTYLLIMVKSSPDPGRLHGKHTKENQTLFTFLTTENLSGLPCSHGANMERIQICPASYAVNLPR